MFLSNMEKLRELAPDQVEIRSGGGCLPIFCIPFLVAGNFLTMVGFGVILPTNANEFRCQHWHHE
jgi:hypothetical protein